jgi:hypothetical protein
MAAAILTTIPTGSSSPAPAPPSATAIATRPLRVALYARVSTRDKAQDVDLQLVPLREYAAARGWVVAEYVDRAPAGDLAGRAAWARLLEDARRRRLDHVLVWKLDRAFRSTLHCLSTLQDLEHRGVGFSCLTQSDVDTTSATGRLLLTLLAAVAEFERYADVGITLVMPMWGLCRPGVARGQFACASGRGTRSGGRHNHRLSRKARRLSGGRERRRPPAAGRCVRGRAP